MTMISAANRTPPPSHLSGFNTPPVSQRRFQVAGARSTIGIDYTPPPRGSSFCTPTQGGNQEQVPSGQYPHYCPVCMMHFSRVLVSDCCNHHLCECCALDLCSAAVASAPLSAALARNAARTKVKHVTRNGNTDCEVDAKAQERASHLSIVLRDPLIGYTKAETSLFQGVCMVECPFCSRHLKAQWRLGDQSVARNYKDTPQAAPSAARLPSPASNAKHLSFNSLIPPDQSNASLGGSPHPAPPAHGRIAAHHQNSSISTDNGSQQGLSKSQVTLRDSRSRSAATNSVVPPTAGVRMNEEVSLLGYVADPDNEYPSSMVSQSHSPDEHHVYATPPPRCPQGATPDTREDGFGSRRSMSTNAPASSQSPTGIHPFTYSTARRGGQGAHRATAMNSTRGWKSGHGSSQMGDGSNGCYALLQRGSSSDVDQVPQRETPGQPSPMKVGSSFEDMRKKLQPLGAILAQQGEATACATVPNPDIARLEMMRQAMRNASEKKASEEVPNWVSAARNVNAEEGHTSQEVNPLLAVPNRLSDEATTTGRHRRRTSSGRRESAVQRAPRPEERKQKSPEKKRAKSPSWNCSIM